MIDIEEIRYFSMFTGVGGFELGLERASDNQQSSEKLQNGQRGNGDIDKRGEMLCTSKNTTFSCVGFSENDKLENAGDKSNLQRGWDENSRSTPSLCDNRDNTHSKKFQCVGFSEIDKFCSKLLADKFPAVKNYGDATKINPTELPEFDMLCGGFPCQSFSIAGKRRGFEDTRGTMFFHIARILEAKRPKLVFLENVKGLLNHDKGETFRVILQTLEELGYEIQWMVLNSKFFGVAQNRERVFIVGSIGGTSRPEILPFRAINKETNGMEQEEKMITYPTLSTELAHSTGRDFFRNGGMKIIQAQKSDREIARIYNPEGISPTLHLKTGGWQEPKIAVLDDYNHRIKSDNIVGAVRQTFNNSKEGNGCKIIEGLKIRRLTPIECERLQGFPDGYTEGFSDTQRYRMMGNAVTVNVIEAIGRKLLNL